MRLSRTYGQGLASLIVLLSLWLSACGGARPALGGVEYTGSVQVDGRSHSYVLFAPNLESIASDVPLLLSLHGGGGTARGMEEFTEVRGHAVRNNYAVLSPNGYQRTWNAGACCDPAAAENIDHVQVLKAMVDDATQFIDVDRSRVYASGHSNGGMMAYRLACQASETFAAVAIVSGHQLNRNYDSTPPTVEYLCNPGRPVPLLHIHGLEDDCAPFFGGQSTGPAGGRRPPVRDALEFWAANNGCNASPDSPDVMRDGVLCENYSACDAGATVRLCSIDIAGHVWPGTGNNPFSGSCGGSGTRALDANEEIWEFVRGYRR